MIMPECGPKCPAHYGIDCDLNPDAVRRCTLEFKGEPPV
ncbi:hypothetical protein LCGC14_0726760 [marine sediment metagenome]|uniref:Uncharacterized protein n=1 Tax=marine sediment metagenome TaxID=412755 RepID=A0A0F9QAV4_9ZZZZ